MTARSRLTRSFLLLAPPILLGTLQIWHPSHVVFEEMLLSPEKARWWFILHLLQLPLFGLLAVSIYKLADGLQHWMVRVNRIALWLFLVFYTALDSISGIATGILFSYLQDAGVSGPEHPLFEPMFDVFLSLFLIEVPGGLWLHYTAIGSWLLMGLTVAALLYIQGYNRLGVISLALGTVCYFSHAYPNGPIGMYIWAAGVFLIDRYPWAITEKGSAGKSV